MNNKDMPSISDHSTRNVHWLIFGLIFLILSVKTLNGVYLSSLELVETYAAYNSSQFDHTIPQKTSILPSDEQSPKQFTFVITGPSQIKIKALEDILESKIDFSHTPTTNPETPLDNRVLFNNPSTNTLSTTIKFENNILTLTKTKSSTNKNNTHAISKNDPLEAYREHLRTQSIKLALNTSTYIVFCIMMSIATYFTLLRYFIEERYSVPKGDQCSIERLQQSLDRSILRYNTLGILLFCFTILIVLISGTLTFSLFASTIDNIKDLEAAKDNVAVILLYIMRTSLLTAFLTTTIIVLYKFSKSAIDQSARFLKRKHATKFLKFLISKVEDTGTIREISPATIAYFSTCIDSNKYLIEPDKNAINTTKFPEINKDISSIRKAHGFPDLPSTANITPNDPLLTTNIGNKSLPERLQYAITQRILYSNIGETLINKIRLDDLEKLMKAFEIWNADIGSAFGDASGKANNSTSISLNSLLKDEKK